MCGIFGILGLDGTPLDRVTLEAAHRVQAHRGPDGRGQRIYHCAGKTLTLAHQRLAIIDLSSAGAQPMETDDGSGSLTYNGELYNYIELRAELASGGVRFSSQSDTEVLLKALHHWGAERALERFNWMGAFAWLDRTKSRLTLACDAGAEKPLYYFGDERRFAFASEIKTLLVLLGGRFALNRDVVGRFMFQGLSDASTDTFFEGIRRLEPGSCATLDLAQQQPQLVVKRVRPPGFPGDPSAMPLPQFVDALRELFMDSVRVRLRSDVPVGVLLSGGIDSSSIAAVAQRLQAHADVPQLLSAVSGDARFDESEHIERMERHLGVRAHRISLCMDPAALVADLTDVNWFNDAPVGGLSAVAHRRMMARARELGLTVILSGQGADELLLGYHKFLGFYLQSLLRQHRPLRAAAVLAAFCATRTVVTGFNISEAKRYVPLLDRLAAGSVPPAAIEGDWLKGWCALPLGLGTGSLAERQLADLRYYSVPALCHYEDRMSMAMSREIRLPFLDSRLVDLLLRAPDAYKLRHGWTKYAFRKAMAPLLPRATSWRRDKKGFANPEGEWLKHELAESVSEAFAPDSLICRHGIINSSGLQKRYERYRRQPVGRGSIWAQEIFAPLSLELWMRRYAAWIA
jgi:asparagine synthase (glutamine-hydrolysing)